MTAAAKRAAAIARTSSCSTSLCAAAAARISAAAKRVNYILFTYTEKLHKAVGIMPAAFIIPNQIIDFYSIIAYNHNETR